MPKDHKMFFMVASHLYKNAHRYWKTDADANELIDVKSCKPENILEKKEDVEVTQEFLPTSSSKCTKEDVKEEVLSTSSSKCKIGGQLNKQMDDPCKDVNKQLCAI